MSLTVLEVYQAYLRERGNAIDKPIGRGSMESLKKRGDRRLFKQLYLTLEEQGLSRHEVNNFMRVNREALGQKFLPQALLKKSAFRRYRKFLRDGGTKGTYYVKLQKNGRAIERYLEEQGQTWHEYFCQGTPPKALIHVKAGKLDEAWVVYAWCFTEEGEVIDNRTSRLLLGDDFYQNLSIVQGRIARNPKVQKILKEGFSRLNK